MIQPAPDIAQQCARAACRSCGGSGLQPVLDLGMMPLSDRLSTPEETQEPRYPLQVAFCPDCSLVQILETVPPEVLFCEDYPYFSSYSDALLDHSRRNALSLIDSQKLGPSSLVVELASNDGYLLRNFVQRSVPVLGIDPAEGPAKVAQEAGVRTIIDFFTLDLAHKLARDGSRADVIIANNVLAHVADLNGFVAGLHALLKDDGIASIEVPYLRELVDHTEFDTIYHEHLCYFSVTALEHLFARHSLRLLNVTPLTIHGGSLRLHVGRSGERQKNVDDYLERERADKLDQLEYYQEFTGRVHNVTTKMRQLVHELRDAGARVAAYGAAAKGAIMLNACGLDHEWIDFVVDRNPHKQGKLMPGLRVPVLDPGELLTRMPQHAILLPWNFKDEILAQQSEYRQRGGKFILPLPQPQIV